MKTKLETVAQVRCSHHLHKVGVTSRGQIVLFDHDKNWMNGARAFVAIGGKPSGCYALLLKWRNVVKGEAVPGTLPLSLREAAKKPIEIHQARTKTRTKNDISARSFRDQVAEKARKAALASVAECEYRKSASIWAGGEHYVSVTITDTHPTVSGRAEHVRSRNMKWSGTNSVFDVSVTPRWYYTIYRRGLAVIDGCLVLDIAEAVDDAHLVIFAGKQGRGFEIKPRKAKATRDEHGQWHLRWIREE